MINPATKPNHLNQVHDKRHAQADTINKKLSNGNFIAKAPAPGGASRKGEIGGIEWAVGISGEAGGGVAKPVKPVMLD